jgi:hypothetical protein
MLLLWGLGCPPTYLSGLGILGGGLKGAGSPHLPLIVLTPPMRFSNVASLQCPGYGWWQSPLEWPPMPRPWLQQYFHVVRSEPPVKGEGGPGLGVALAGVLIDELVLAARAARVSLRGWSDFWYLSNLVKWAIRLPTVCWSGGFVRQWVTASLNTPLSLSTLRVVRM